MPHVQQGWVAELTLHLLHSGRAVRNVYRSMAVVTAGKQTGELMLEKMLPVNLADSPCGMPAALTTKDSMPCFCWGSFYKAPPQASKNTFRPKARRVWQGSLVVSTLPSLQPPFPPHCNSISLCSPSRSYRHPLSVRASTSSLPKHKCSCVSLLPGSKRSGLRMCPFSQASFQLPSRRISFLVSRGCGPGNRNSPGKLCPRVKCFTKQKHRLSFLAQITSQACFPLWSMEGLMFEPSITLPAHLQHID